MYRNSGWGDPTSVAGRPPIAETPVPPVTQDELAQLLRDRELIKAAKKRSKNIKERMLSGAAVEPGRYRATIKERESRHFTAAKLAALVGSEYVAHLRNSIEPTTQRSLIIDEMPDE